MYFVTYKNPKFLTENINKLDIWGKENKRGILGFRPNAN